MPYGLYPGTDQGIDLWDKTDSLSELQQPALCKTPFLATLDVYNALSCLHCGSP